MDASILDAVNDGLEASEDKKKIQNKVDGSRFTPRAVPVAGAARGMEGQRGRESSESGQELAVGCTVKIAGLKGAPQHNGCHGQLTGFDADKGRWGVRLAADGQVLGVRPENLVFVRPPASPYDDEDEDEKITRLKRKFDKVCRKYKLTGDETASEIADLLTGAAGLDKVGPSYFVDKYKMEQTDAEAFLAWIKCAVNFKETTLDPNADAAQQYAETLNKAS